MHPAKQKCTPKIADEQDTGKKKRRAPKACLRCRARKVRCDVAYHGSPCMNCYLDHGECVVPQRRARNISQLLPNPDIDHPDVANIVITEDESSLPNEHPDNASQCSTMTTPPQHHPGGSSNTGTYLHDKTSGRDWKFVADIDPSSRCYDGMLTEEFRCLNRDRRLPGVAEALVPFSHFPFLELDGLFSLSAAEESLLDLQGCFRVPNRYIMDEFMHQYFRHVHPLLPILNEPEFWRIYRAPFLGSGSDEEKCPKFSLFVFQALFFVSCGFVSQSSLRQLGFTTIRDAKKAFYYRAKGLFDHETVYDAVSISQGALLLSYWGRIDDGKCTNTFWLNIALENARNAEAHKVALKSHLKSNGVRLSELKRLWWCCMVRDRLMSLGLRRPLHITKDHFDFSAKSSRITKEDLLSEIGHSEVYNSLQKGMLCQVFLLLCELCSSLTDILLLIHPLSGETFYALRPPAVKNKVSVCNELLSKWYKTSYQNYKAHVEECRSGHSSIPFFIRLIEIYFHSARVSLFHYQVLQLALSKETDESLELSSVKELKDAFQGIVDCSEDLYQRQQAQYTPSTAAACTALPLFLCVLDVKLANQSQEISRIEKDRSRRQLAILANVMAIYRCQYEGAETISETIMQIAASRNAPLQSSCWSDMIVHHPRMYLRLAMNLELTLTKGRHPQEWEFPQELDLPRALPFENLVSTGTAKPAETSMESEEETEIEGSIANAATDLSQDMEEFTTLSDDSLDDLVIPTMDSMIWT